MAVKLNRSYLEGFVENGEYERLKAPVRLAHEALLSKTARGSEYTGWLSLPEDYDKEEFEMIKAAAKRIRDTSDVLVVIGIGGSYLGARAVIELLGSQYFNDLSPLKVYYSGNSISPDSLKKLLKLCEGKRVAVNVVSKSGTTLEPALAFRVFKSYMEECYGKEEAAKRIFVTTDKARGALKTLSDSEGYESFVIPDDIGGRYSVLTAVGLLPIAAAGFDIDALMAGARNAMKSFAAPDMDSNACYAYAASRFILAEKGKLVELCVCFEPAFYMFGEWYKQLFGESEGKEHKGIFPSSLVFSTDLHSMGQYVQEGKRILFETVVRFLESSSDITVESDKDNFDGLNYIADKSMSYINRQASDGVLLAHTEGGVPNLLIEVDRIDEYNVGELIYFFEKACAVSGALIGINPFDQPGVEGYKTNMFALLDKPGFEAEGERLRAKLL
ncbi:MAG: glucose-6-phosphate isomerase [Oscillospiraceae bacterium]|nr:glucose-6-phosphate isomerase [Oscillospiraceae bacterium]